MYFLEHYNELLQAYQEYTGQTPDNADAEHSAFYHDMDFFHKFLQRIEGKAALEKTDVERISYYYASLVDRFGTALKQSDHADTKKYVRMSNEADSITFIDTRKHKALNAAIDDAREKMTSQTPATLNTPRTTYMATKSNPVDEVSARMDDLQEDRRFLNDLADDLLDSKRHVFGSPSQQFVNMETAYNELSALNDRIRESMDKNQTVDSKMIDEYRNKLKDLNEKARAYEVYKSNSKTHFKAKETRRILFSQKLQQFAQSRANQMFQMDERNTLLEMTKLNKQAFSIRIEEQVKKADEMNLQSRSRNAYGARVRKEIAETRNLNKYFNEESGELSLAKIFLVNNYGSKHKAPSARGYETTLKQIMAGAFGGLSDDPRILAEGEKFLQTGKISSDLYHSSMAALKYAKKEHPADAHDAKYKVPQELVKRISSMDRIEGNYLFIAGLLKASLTYPVVDPKTNKPTDKNEDLTKKMSQNMKNTIKGIDDAVSIVKNGQSAWEKLQNKAAQDPAEYRETLLDFVTMKTMEMQIARFNRVRKETDHINPFFTWLGATRNGVDKIRNNISSTKTFQNLLNLPAEKIYFLVNNSTEKTDAGFENLMLRTYSKAFEKFMNAPKKSNNQELQVRRPQPERKMERPQLMM